MRAIAEAEDSRRGAAPLVVMDCPLEFWGCAESEKTKSQGEPMPKIWIFIDPP
jgi:hypothetical protein